MFRHDDERFRRTERESDRDRYDRDRQERDRYYRERSSEQPYDRPYERSFDRFSGRDDESFEFSPARYSPPRESWREIGPREGGWWNRGIGGEGSRFGERMSGDWRGYGGDFGRERERERDFDRDRDFSDRDRGFGRGRQTYFGRSEIYEPSWRDRERNRGMYGEGYGGESYRERGDIYRGENYRGESPRTNWTEGRFTGRGPKGYQRSDDRIREEVCDVLTDHPAIDATNIEVVVKGSEVTLSGLVQSRADKRLAEDVVEDISGVREVHNHLKVSREAPTATGEGQMAQPGQARTTRRDQVS